MDALVQDVPILGDEPGTCLDNDHCKPQWDDAYQVMLDIDRRLQAGITAGWITANDVKKTLGLGDAPNSNSD